MFLLETKNYEKFDEVLMEIWKQSKLRNYCQWKAVKTFKYLMTNKFEIELGFDIEDNLD